MQNKAKVKIGKMNISIVVIKDYDKNNKQPTTNVIQNKAKQSQFKAKKMLLSLTINGRRKSFGYYADEIEAPNACDRAAG
ncbi:MAG: hypothetical protein ACYSW7_11885 [Planctomycetota bacterium]|jgi:hypothetical protein